MIARPAQSVLPPDTHGVRSLQFRALGTQCVIKFRQPDEDAALHFAADALGWISDFEASYSRYKPDSVVSRINAAAGKDWVTVDPATEQLLDVAADLHRDTGGILDITILPLLRVWDWKTVHQHLPEPAAVSRALALTGWDKVQRKPGSIFLPEAGMGLDFGGFGKEFAVDAVVHIARSHGLTDCLVDLGRDVFAMGGNGVHPFWHVGLEDGDGTGQCGCGVAVNDRAVCSSGNYARRFVHNGVSYGHILDPRTGWPVSNGMMAVTAISRSCLEAGIYSTAVYVLGVRDGLDLASRIPGLAVRTQSDAGINGTQNFGRWLVQEANTQSDYSTNYSIL